MTYGCIVKQERATAIKAPPENGQQTENLPSQINARTKIIEVLTRVDTRQAYTDKLLDKELDKFNDADRALITEVVNGALRWRYRLDWFLRQLYVGEFDNLIPDVKNNLRSSIYQLIYLDRVPAYAVLNEAVEISKKKYNQKTANLVNAILRNYLRQVKKLEYVEMQLDFSERLSVSYSHPLWLIQRWIERWGVDHALALCQANNERPVVSLRANLLKTDLEEFKQKLQEFSIDFEQHEHFPTFFHIPNFKEFRKLNFIESGLVSVQDISTCIPVQLLDAKPGERVLDMCAAPGGKSGYIGEMMQGEGMLVSMEKHHNRSRMLQDNLSRLGVSNFSVVTADALEMPFSEPFDKILLDAPCTGFGVLSKRVDLKWKRTEADIENMSQLQGKLLDAAADMLVPGGVIVYSTCTIEYDENEGVIQQFLSRHPEFTTDTLSEYLPTTYLWEKDFARTFPHVHKMDGSFAIRLRKKAESN